MRTPHVSDADSDGRRDVGGTGHDLEVGWFRVQWRRLLEWDHERDRRLLVPVPNDECPICHAAVCVEPQSPSPIARRLRGTPARRPS